MRCPVTRDTWVSGVKQEVNANTGKVNRLKLKGKQEFFLFDIDAGRLKGKIVTGALLHVRCATPKAPFPRVGVSTIASPWVEGTVPRSDYSSQEGSSCFNQAEYKTRDWAYPGSTIVDVVFGRGHTLWRFADATLPDADGWQALAVDADVVAARAAGLSYGFFAQDEVGNIWSVKDGEFKHQWTPNRFCHSRESKGSEPWLEVWTSGADTVAPAAVNGVSVRTKGLPPGTALVRWITPADEGGGKTLGFNVTYEQGKKARAMPRYLVPMARRTGEEVRMFIQDLPFRPGEEIVLTIDAVDSAGNVSEPFSRSIRLSDEELSFAVPEADISPFTPSETLPRVAGIKVAVVDLLDKVHPVTGEMIPPQAPGYKGGNHIYSAAKRLIRLQCARNETVSFQLNLEGLAQKISVDYDYRDNPALKPGLFEFAYVNTRRGPLPDPLLPLDGAFSIPSAAGQVKVEGQTNHSLVCELYVPHEEASGRKEGSVTVRVGGETLTLRVELTVWDFALPNKLSFVPEMNCYATVNPYAGEHPGKGYPYYRLAHEHRTCINSLPYNWSGRAHFAPDWKGDGFDWTQWDKMVGPLLDGSAFKKMRRSGEPLDVFYVPFNENWPMSIKDGYTPSYWADEAFSDEYREGLKKAWAAFAEHCRDKEWTDTIFEFYLNNKVYNRAKDPKGTAPWVFEEMLNTQDFWATRWFGIVMHQGVDSVKGPVKMFHRIDTKRDSRELFWGVADIEYIGANNAQKTRMKIDEQRLWGKAYFAEFGCSNHVETSNIQPALWCIAAWSKGADGVLPWQTKGSSWKKGSQTCIFYGHETGPKPSVRLKSYTRGEQDIEYLTLLKTVYGKTRFATANALGKMIDLTGDVRKTFEDDAGTLVFKNSTRPQDLWAARYRVGAMVSAKHPPYQRALVERENLDNDMRRLPRVGYVPVAPPVERYKPECDDFIPWQPRRKEKSTAKKAPKPGMVLKNAVTLELKGKKAIRDCGISAFEPEAAGTGYSCKVQVFRNDLRKYSGLLVNPDLSSHPLGKKIGKATLVVKVWDCNSRSDNKLGVYLVRTGGWDDGQACFSEKAQGMPWQGGKSFRLGIDTDAEPAATAICPKDAGSDTQNPPVRVEFDVTELIRKVRSNPGQFHGLFVTGIPDRKTDEGRGVRVQIHTVDSGDGGNGPELVIVHEE